MTITSDVTKAVITTIVVIIILYNIDIEEPRWPFLHKAFYEGPIDLMVIIVIIIYINFEEPR